MCSTTHSAAKIAAKPIDILDAVQHLVPALPHTAEREVPDRSGPLPGGLLRGRNDDVGDHALLHLNRIQGAEHAVIGFGGYGHNVRPIIYSVTLAMTARFPGNGQCGQWGQTRFRERPIPSFSPVRLGPMLDRKDLESIAVIVKADAIGANAQAKFRRFAALKAFDVALLGM